MSIRNLANAYELAGNIEQAVALHEEALEKRRSIYSKSNGFEIGHPHLAESLRDTVLANEETGMLERAEQLLLEAVAMYRQLYPADSYPKGHFELAASLDELGELYYRKGEFTRALQRLEEATSMRYDLADDFLSFAAEAEARNFVHVHLKTPGTLLDLWRRLNVPPDVQYELLWRGRRILPRMLAARQDLHAYGDQDPAARERIVRYLAIRHRLSSLSMASADSQSAVESRLQEIRELTEEKESIERELFAKLSSPAVPGELESREGPTQLLRLLPRDAAWVDLMEYDPHEKGNRGGSQIVVFIACQDKWSRVDLGDEGTIAELCGQFHDSIRHFVDAPQTVSKLTERVWEPIRLMLTEETSHLYLCPDGSLAQLAWPALRNLDGAYLVERYNFELVPHGPFLLNALSAAKSAGERQAETKTAPLVGGVDFGRSSNEAAAETGSNAMARLTRSAGSEWNALPGAKQEIDEIARLLQDDRDGWSIDLLTMGQASTDNVLQHLESLCIAHFATHGLFAFDSVGAVGTAAEPSSQLLRQSFERNPLLASGLVLAGANRAPEHGLLLAEAIASRPMRGLDLVVLSACDSGQGRLLRGEGVYGLQQAFHLAGAKHVVASRWKVDDDGTRALMTEFYRNLLSKKYSISEALRQAQLTMIESYDTSAGVLRGTIRPAQPVKDEVATESSEQRLRFFGLRFACLAVSLSVLSVKRWTRWGLGLLPFHDAPSDDAASGRHDFKCGPPCLATLE